MAAVLLTAVPSTALAVYAHPDDADVSCGGTLASWAAARCAVHLLICTVGDKGSSDPRTDPEALVARRVEEVDKASKALGLTAVHRLGRRDGTLENDESLRAEIVGIVRQVRPDTVVCPDPTAVLFGEHYFNHHDHRVVGWAALDAVAPAASSPLYHPDRGAAHQVRLVLLSGTLEPSVFVDVSASVDAKADAIVCHASQVGETGEWFRTVVRERAEEAGRAAGVRYAEGFRRLALTD